VSRRDSSRVSPSKSYSASTRPSNVEADPGVGGAVPVRVDLALLDHAGVVALDDLGPSVLVAVLRLLDEEVRPVAAPGVDHAVPVAVQLLADALALRVVVDRELGLPVSARVPLLARLDSGLEVDGGLEAAVRVGVQLLPGDRLPVVMGPGVGLAIVVRVGLGPDALAARVQDPHVEPAVPVRVLLLERLLAARVEGRAALATAVLVLVDHDLRDHFVPEDGDPVRLPVGVGVLLQAVLRALPVDQHAVGAAVPRRVAPPSGRALLAVEVDPGVDLPVPRLVLLLPDQAGTLVELPEVDLAVEVLVGLDAHRVLAPREEVPTIDLPVLVGVALDPRDRSGLGVVVHDRLGEGRRGEGHQEPEADEWERAHQFP
jgi:hypothetical protein